MLDARTIHKRACRVLPEVLAASGVLLEDESPNGLAALLFPLRRKSSGAVAFQLSAETLDALQEDPMHVLQDALQARHGLFRHASAFTYRPWRTVRMPGIGEVAHFTTSHNGKALIVVIPLKGLVIYLWNDEGRPLEIPLL